MESKKQNNDNGNSLSMKWVYIIIVALAVGFGAYGYFKVKQWVHYTVIENTEKPITGYTITKISADEHRPYRHRGYNDDNEKERTPDYYMEVWYQGKDYKLEIDESTYRVFKDNGDVNLYYDSEADEVFVAAFGEPLVVAKQPIAHVRFEGIAFEYAYGTGISIAGTDVQIVGCRVACCGGTGVSLHGDRNLMRGCEVAQVGRAGVSAGGGDRKTLRRAESVFEGNRVHDFGVFQRTYAPGFSVHGCGVTLRANALHDAPHSAVLYGGNEHLFEYNNVYRVLLETGDAGAYYTGRDWTTQGNLLRFNYTHDLGAEGEMANTMGFYFDDCDCGDEVYGNVFHNVSRGIMVGGGREHPIRNNVFSRCLVGMSIDCRGMTWKHWNSVSVGGSSWLLEDKAKAFDYTNGVWAARYPRLADIMNDHPREPLYNPVENNVFIDCRQQVLALGKEAPMERMAPIANNVVVNTRGTNGVKCASVDARIAAGFTVLNGSTDAPCAFGFADAANGDFRFLPGAEILKVCPGFQLLPLDRIAR